MGGRAAAGIPAHAAAAAPHGAGELIAAGATNAEIARRLVVSDQTAKTHVSHVLRKLRASNRAEAVSRYHAITQRDGR